MPEFSDERFKYLFWFCVFVFTISFAAMLCLIYIPVPEANEGMANNTQGFLQGSLIMSAIGFLLTGSIGTQPRKPGAPGGGGLDTLDLSLTATTGPAVTPNPATDGSTTE